MSTQPELSDGIGSDASPAGVPRSAHSDSGPRLPKPHHRPPFHCHTELRATVAEASRWLALLDADRLEELATACQNMNSDVRLMGPAERADLARQAHEASKEIAVFAHVIEATRANLQVMLRLRDLREGCNEYDCPRVSHPEGIHGDD